MRATLIDGTSFDAFWGGAVDPRAVTLHREQETEVLVLDELMQVSFSPHPIAPVGDAVLHLADGGTLYAALATESSANTPGELPAGAAIVASSLLGERRSFPFNTLAGVSLRREDALPRARDLFIETLSARLAGQDVLISQSDGEAKALRGRLDALFAEQGRFDFGGRLRTVLRDRLYGVVLASGAAPPTLYPVRVTLADGSEFGARLSTSPGERLRLTTSMGFVVDLDVQQLAELHVASDRVVYLSDLTPVAEEGAGLLHAPWPVRRDQSVSTGPLRLGGQTFARGLGVHSRSSVTYRLSGAFDRLAATIGIDDEVRPRGSVVFQVLGDGRALFDSGLLTGRDDPRNILVDLRGVNDLTLIVDYGDGLDLADQAIWGGVRLLKPTVRTAPRGGAP